MIFLNKLLVKHLFVLGAKTPMEVPVELKRLVDGIFADTLAFASIQEASEVAGLVEVLQHRLDALAVEIVDNVDRCGCNTQDGHSNVRSWSAFTCRTTGTEASRRLSLAKAFRQLPTTAARYRAGVLGREQVGCLATACASDRYGRLVVKSEADSQHH